MNFAYGVIVIVGVLAAIILGLIAVEPDGIVEPRIVSVEEETMMEETVEEETMMEETVEEETMMDETMTEEHMMDGTMEAEHLMEETMDEEIMEETIDEEIMEETADISEIPPVESESDVETLPMTLTIAIPEGVGVLGCEETRECFSPYEVSVAVGATVTWSNDDTVVHTVTSGKGMLHDELFDSSIFMSGDTFETTFNDAGSFDYFCLVHPWMTGIVHVS